MPGKSTEDAVVELRRADSASEGRYAVALLFDIFGAFDNVWWPLVLQGLKSREYPKNVFEVLGSYFDKRLVSISIGDTKVSKWATRGCPQGSVLGPTCWNLIFDELLRIETQAKDRSIAYADDLVILVNGNSRREIEVKSQELVDQIVGWCKSAKLQISERLKQSCLEERGVKEGPSRQTMRSTPG